jgi:hypothetical protein
MFLLGGGLTGIRHGGFTIVLDGAEMAGGSTC